MAEDYRVSHTAPTDDGYSKPITEATSLFGEDVLKNPGLYGSHDEQTMTQLESVLGGSESVRVYRAVPAGVDFIAPGDWVSLSREYAHDHGWNEDPAEIMPVIAADVPVRDVYTDGNDLSEWGYAGPRLEGLPAMREGDLERAGSSPALGGESIERQAGPEQDSLNGPDSSRDDFLRAEREIQAESETVETWALAAQGAAERGEYAEVWPNYDERSAASIANANMTADHQLDMRRQTFGVAMAGAGSGALAARLGEASQRLTASSERLTELEDPASEANSAHRIVAVHDRLVERRELQEQGVDAPTVDSPSISRDREEERTR